MEVGFYLRTRGREEELEEQRLYKPLKCFNQREVPLKAVLETFLVLPCTPGLGMRSLLWEGSGERKADKGISSRTVFIREHVSASSRAACSELRPGRSCGPSSHSGAQCCLSDDGFEILWLTFPALEAIQGLCLEVL